MPNTPTAFFGYNKPATGDSGWGDTWNDNLDDQDSDFAAEHRYSVGNRGKHGPKVTIDQTNADNALVIDHSPPSSFIAIDINRTTTFGGDIINLLNSGTGNAIQITQAGAGSSVTIDQNGAATAINVTQNATNNKTLFLRKTGTGAGTVLDIDNTGTGDGAYIAQVGESRALYVEKASTGASRAMVIDNSGTGQGLNILQKANGIALDISKTNTGAADVIAVLSSAAGDALDIINSGSGNAIYIHQDVNSIALRIDKTNGGTANVIQIDNDGGGHSLNITQDGTGRAINIGQNGAGLAVGIAQGTDNDTLQIDKNAAGAGKGIVINNSGTGDGEEINVSGDGIGFQINNTNTSHTQDSVEIFHGGSGIAIVVSKTSTVAGNIIDITNSSSSPDIDGHASLWQVSPNGQGRFARTASRVKDALSEENTFSSIFRWDQIAMSSAQGGSTLDSAYAGAAYDGRYIYFSSNNSDTFVSYDTTQSFASIDAWEQIAMSSAQGAAALDGAYASVVFDGRYIYMAPIDSDTFIRHDTQRPFTSIASWQQVAASSAQGAAAVDGAYVGITFDGRYVYYTPLASDTFVRFDTKVSFTDITSWAQMSTNSAQGAVADVAYQSCTFDGQYVYYAPRSSETFIRFDTTASFTAVASWQQISQSSASGFAAQTTEAYASATFDGRYVYYCAVNSDTFLRYDTTRSFTGITSWERIGMNSATGSAVGDSAFNGCTCDGKFVYFMPSNFDTMMRFDVTQPFTSISSWVQIAVSSAIGGTSPGAAAAGGTFDGSYIYYTPRSADSFVRFRANNATTTGPTEYAQVSG